MPYLKIYEIQLTPANTSDIIFVRIHDKESYTDLLVDETVISLNDERDRVPEGNLRISVIDNEEDKFSPIKAKQAVFSFFSSNTFNLNMFATGEDDRWYVKIYQNTVDENSILFYGFLMLSDISESFQDPPNVVTLTATDNIGLLKDVPLVDEFGHTPRGKFSLAHFVAMCLRKTKLDIPIWIVNNITEEQFPGVSYYETTYLDAKTFEDQQGTSINCYEVLQRILGEDSYLVQWAGGWFIIRIDELENDNLYAHQFTSTGFWVTRAIIPGVVQEIGSHPYAGTIWVSESARVSLQPRHKSVKLSYNYNFPLEIVDNQDFSRGTDWLSVIPVDLGLYIKSYANLGAFPSAGEYDVTYKANDTGIYYRWNGTTYNVTTNIPTGKAYVFEDWGLESLSGNPPSISTYIAKIYNGSGYEIERYAVLSNGGAGHHVKSNFVELNRNDKFNFSIDRRLSSNQPGDSGNPNATEDFAQIRLYGEDGSYWTLTNVAQSGEPAGAWIQSNSSFSFNARTIRLTYNNVDGDETKWQSVSVEAFPLPVNGKVQICLIQSTVYGTATIATHFTNLQFDYIPFINGSYQKYSGHYFKISQGGNYKPTREKEVFIAATPNKLFKGALFKYDGIKYIPVGRFYNGAVFPLGVPANEFLVPLGQLQAQAVWNQYNREMRILDGDLYYLKTEQSRATLPDFPHTYRMLDFSPHTNNKRFMILHGTIDYDKNQFNDIRLVEVHSSTIPKVYTDPVEFKYISD